MICAVEWKRSSCALKSFKIGFKGIFFKEISVVSLSRYFSTSGAQPLHRYLVPIGVRSGLMKLL